MAAYRRVYDSRHLQADCQESVIDYGPAWLYLYPLVSCGHRMQALMTLPEQYAEQGL